jgi:acetylglutamate kinase
MSGLTVVKLGGSTLGQHDTSLDDIAALHAEGRALVIVHGGGATISEWLERFGLESRFTRGLRVTDEQALDVVVAVLAGLVNKRLVAELGVRGASAIGVSGADGGLLRARRADPDLGFVGEIMRVEAAPLRAIVEGGSVAVVAPIAVEAQGGQLLNINGDTAAGEIAAALGAESLVFLTDVAGVLDGEGAPMTRLGETDARDLLAHGTVSGGMIPKVKAALRAAESGVTTVIADGRRDRSLRDALGGAAPGTVIAG